MSDFPTLIEIIEIHKRLIVKFGGSHGIRELGALESAVMRPQLGYYNDIIEEAAALLESLAMNHPFIDGNKRVAFAATDLFLIMNGKKIQCPSKQAYDFFINLFETQRFRYAELLEWLRAHVK